MKKSSLLGALLFFVVWSGLADGQGIEEIRHYLAVRDQLTQIKALLQSSLTGDPGTGILANPAAEGEIRSRLQLLDADVHGMASMTGPLAEYYSERLQRLSADCQALFPLFVQRLALGVHGPFMTGNPPNPLLPPAPAPVSPTLTAAAKLLTPVAMAPGELQARPPTPSQIPASFATVLPGGPALVVPAPVDLAGLRKRREFFHPIWFRLLLDPRLARGRGRKPAMPHLKLPPPPEPPPTTIPVSAVAALPLPAVPRVKVASAPAVQFPQLPRPIDSLPLTIQPLEPWPGKDPQVRETPGMRPLAIMIENHNQARPQTAVDEAEVVYEIPVEGGITRFMALFYHVPGVVGPVRSCREYFLDRALEVNALYVHCGGSPNGYAYIAKQKAFAIDEISNGSPFFRDSNRKAPHNLYTRGKDLIEVMNRKYPMQLPYSAASPDLRRISDRLGEPQSWSVNQVSRELHSGLPVQPTL